jgi:hypothetical protein
MTFENQLGPLVEAAVAAKKAADDAVDAARTARRRVNDLLRGKKILVTGNTTHHIVGRRMDRELRHFDEEPATVVYAHYYIDSDDNHLVDSLRFRTSDGEEWQMVLSGAQVMITGEQTAEEQLFATVTSR